MNIMLKDQEIVELASEFLERFRLVFEYDWEFTQATLQIPAESHFIAAGGTFINPGISDESNNWANRGALLSTYRRLDAVLPTKVFV